jgi:hypothetical protein
MNQAWARHRPLVALLLRRAMLDHPMIRRLPPASLHRWKIQTMKAAEPPSGAIHEDSACSLKNDTTQDKRGVGPNAGCVEQQSKTGSRF